jgi:hypothetical protein
MRQKSSNQNRFETNEKFNSINKKRSKDTRSDAKICFVCLLVGVFKIPNWFS